MIRCDLEEKMRLGSKFKLLNYFLKVFTEKESLKQFSFIHN